MSTKRPVTGREGETRLADGAVVTFQRRGVFSSSEASALFRDIMANTAWKREMLTVYGAEHLVTRETCYQGASEELSYAYSGITIVPSPFDERVEAVRQKVQALFPEAPEFNTCLLNYYRSGQDSLGWHDDNNVARYGANPSIASVSFGAERAFQKCNEQKVEFSLGGGAVLLMSGTAQATWQHSVPKRAGLPGARINLTFRRVLTAEDHAAAKRPRR